MQQNLWIFHYSYCNSDERASLETERYSKFFVFNSFVLSYFFFVRFWHFTRNVPYTSLLLIFRIFIRKYHHCHHEIIRQQRQIYKIFLVLQCILWNCEQIHFLINRASRLLFRNVKISSSVAGLTSLDFELS